MLFIYLAVIIYLSLIPGNEIIFLNLWKYDKFIHFIEYFGVGFLLLNAMKQKNMNLYDWIFTISFIIIFPIFDELLQYYTPYRISDKYDVIADVMGGTFGLYIREKFI